MNQNHVARLDAKPIAISYSGNASIVVIGGDKDPATPFRWAEKMSKNLKGSILVKYTGEGHSSVGSNYCTSKVASNVLVKKELPVAGKECGVDRPLPEPTWWASDTKSVPGERFSRFDFGRYFGFPVEEFYSEFIAIKGDLKTTRATVLSALERRGLVNMSPENDGVDAYIFLGNPAKRDEFVGVGFIDETQLGLNELNGENGPFPSDSTLTVIYTYIEE
jgi:hypothetical protein